MKIPVTVCHIHFCTGVKKIFHKYAAESVEITFIDVEPISSDWAYAFSHWTTSKGGNKTNGK